MGSLPSPTKQNGLGLTSDRAREGDQVVKSEGGRNILLTQSNLVTELERMVFDRQEMPEGIGFYFIQALLIAMNGRTRSE